MTSELDYLLAVLCLNHACIVAGADDKEKTSVSTDVGTFVGYVYKFDAFGKKLSSRRFLQIPYAQPPVGNLRFKKPMQMEKLSQPHDATKIGAACMQQEIPVGGKRKQGMFESLTVSEDCLFLNIYTPSKDVSSKGKLPVMVYIHGGGFVCGATNLFPGDVFAAYGQIIFVTVAYRLSIWGFLSTGDENLPGNYGLWDQRMAIQWVNENIAKFGGDPDSVTLIGMSAGGASVIYQSILPDNTGLFKRGIPQSGSITRPWAFNPDPLTSTKRLARLVDCDNTKTTKDLAKCLVSKSSAELQEALNDEKSRFRRFPMEFVPVVDHDFLPESPNNIFHGSSDIAMQYQNAFANIDLMTGVVTGEGLMMTTHVVGVDNMENYEADRNTLENELVPEVLRVAFGNKVPDILRYLVINEYTHWDNPDNSVNSREAYLELSGDYVFNIQMVETASLHSQISDKSTFVYLYDTRLSRRILEAPSWAGKAVHGEDLTTLLGYDRKDGFSIWTEPYTEDPPEEWELELSKLHMTMFANFAKSGNPNTPKDVKPYIKTSWPQYDTESQFYLNISRQMSEKSVGQRLFARASNFWHSVLPRTLDAVQAKSVTREKNYCERDRDCEP